MNYDSLHKADSNINLAKGTLENLLSAGLHEIVLCSGNRNAPFIAVVSAQDDAQVFHHFSEASASYFALGRIKQHGKPVAVVVTSGTAALQLAPAATEAAYSKLPLVLLTADRPKNYRGTAAPQSINQKDVFGANLENSFDIDSSAQLPSPAQLAEMFQSRSPVHLNVCFDEPLIDQEPSSWVFEFEKIEPKTAASVDVQAEVEAFLEKNQAPLAIIGRLPSQYKDSVRDFLLSLQAPVFAEGLSGLREDAKLSPLLLESGDAVLRKGGFDSILRIGSVPTLGFWRDLERNTAFNTLPVFSITQDGFSGLARESSIVDLAGDLQPLATSRSGADSLFKVDASIAPQLVELYARFPQSEPALYHQLSQEIEDDALVYLGNSLPIRLWDLSANRKANSQLVDANRGVNGIDGQLSTFFGAARSGRLNWGIFGDLTTLYDLEAPYILEQLDPAPSFRLVIVNNQGGRIFELLPDYNKHFRDNAGDDAFIQPQSVNFERFAGLWNLEFVSSSQVPRSSELPSQVVLEITPDNGQTREFWAAYKKLFA